MRRFFSTVGDAQGKAAHQLVKQKVESKISLVNASKDALPSKTRVLFVTRKDAKTAPSPNDLQALLPFQVSIHALADFKAKPEEKVLLYPSSNDKKFQNQKLLLVGLGEEEKVDENAIRKATHGALGALKVKKIKDVVLEVPQLQDSKLSASRIVELLSQVRLGLQISYRRTVVNKSERLPYNYRLCYCMDRPPCFPIINLTSI